MSDLYLRNGTWYVKKVINQEVLYKSTKTTDKKVAERLAAKWISEFHQQVVIEGKKPIKLIAAIDKFLETRKHMKSIQNLEIHLRYFRAMPDIQLDKITDAHVQDLLQQKRDEGYAESTLKISVAYFNTMLKTLDELGYTVRKKLKAIKHNSQRLRWLTRDELARLYVALDPSKGNDELTVAQKQDNFDLVRLLYETGCRFSEIAELKWTQVNLANGTVFIKRKKGSIDGTILMTATMREILECRQAIDPEDVFPTKKARSNNKFINAAVKRAELDQTEGSISLHTLRHSRAVHLLQKGLGVLELQKYLGHRNFNSTLVYAHVVQSDVIYKVAQLTD